jgi:lipopolysaccharide heptosyltransferase II
MKILLIRLRRVGDVVFTTPAVRALRRALPAAHLAYLVETEAAPVVERNPHLDRVLAVPRPRGWRRLLADGRLAWRVRAARYDVVIDFHGGPRSAWLSWASGAPVRIGYELPGRDWVYTHRVARPRVLRPRHSVVNQWDLLAPLHPSLARPPDPRTDPVEMPEDPAAAAAVDRRLRLSGVEPTDPLLVVHVSAGNRFRRWPVASFVDLCARLVEADERRRLVITSGPSDHLTRTAVQEALTARLGRRAAALVGDHRDFTLAELRALVGRASLFIGGDSGPLHVAATTRVPIVGIYGPTVSARSAPWRDPGLVTEAVELAGLACRPCEQRRCLPGDFRCLTHLTAEEVYAAAERALARAAARDAQRAGAAGAARGRW